MALPGISLSACSFFPSLEQGPHPLPPSPPRHSHAPLKGIHSLPIVAMVTAPAGPAPPLPAPKSASAPFPTCQAGRAPGAGPELLHGLSTLRAVSGELCSPALHHSQALHPPEHWEKDVSSKIPVVDGDMRALCSQPLAQDHHGGNGKAQGDGGRGGFGLVGAALGVSGSKKHCTNMLGFSCCSPFLTTAILCKSKGELWLHPYLWQSHLLSPTPPREAWHHSFLCSWKDPP